MLSYQYKLVYSNGFLVLERRKVLLGFIPLNSWSSLTLPFNSVQSLNNICERRGIKKIIIENIEKEVVQVKPNYYEDCLR
jgi:hypothetical protein